MTDEIENYVRIGGDESGQFSRIVEEHIAELNDVVGYAEREYWSNIIDLDFDGQRIDARFTIGSILYDHGYYISEIVARTDEKTSIPSDASHRLFIEDGDDD